MSSVKTTKEQKETIKLETQEAMQAAAYNDAFVKKFRSEVEAEKLESEMSKAKYEKMYFFIEARKIQDEFREVIKKVQKEKEDEEAAYIEQMKSQLENQITSEPKENNLILVP